MIIIHQNLINSFYYFTFAWVADVIYCDTIDKISTQFSQFARNANSTHESLKIPLVVSDNVINLLSEMTNGARLSFMIIVIDTPI